LHTLNQKVFPDSKNAKAPPGRLIRK